MSVLYLVSTPIGNLEDLSFRALRILKEAALIAAEDTRISHKLLKHYQIETPLTSFHDHNKEKKTVSLLEHLQESDLALISDAGTPAINDPGFFLVRAALEAGHQVVPIPGPSAPVAALSASGLPTDQFLYLGYFPRKDQSRRKVLKEIFDLPWTLVVLETPHRLVKSLNNMLEILGDREIVVARELTKLHEEILRGQISEVIKHYSNKEPKGEITLVISGKSDESHWSHNQLILEIKEQLRSGKSNPSQLAKDLAKISGWSRRDIYDLMQGLENEK